MVGYQKKMHLFCFLRPLTVLLFDLRRLLTLVTRSLPFKKLLSSLLLDFAFLLWIVCIPKRPSSQYRALFLELDQTFPCLQTFEVPNYNCGALCRLTSRLLDLTIFSDHCLQLLSLKNGLCNLASCWSSLVDDVSRLDTLVILESSSSTNLRAFFICFLYQPLLKRKCCKEQSINTFIPFFEFLNTAFVFEDSDLSPNIRSVLGKSTLQCLFGGN